MKLWRTFWAYWKWLCVALLTSFVILAVLSALILSFRERPLGASPAERCLDSGGTWDEEAGACKSSA